MTPPVLAIATLAFLAGAVSGVVAFVALAWAWSFDDG